MSLLPLIADILGLFGVTVWEDGSASHGIGCLPIPGTLCD